MAAITKARVPESSVTFSGFLDLKSRAIAMKINGARPSTTMVEVFIGFSFWGDANKKSVDTIHTL